MEHKIAVLPGDGIGEEVMEQALRVLQKISDTSGHKFKLTRALVGGAAYDQHNTHFPEETKEICLANDAILFGSVGGPVSEQHLPKWKNCEANSILAMRKNFNFYANFRPVKVFPQLSEMCPLKKELVEKGIDILFVRELVGDIYFGEHRTFIENGIRKATDVAQYTEEQIADVAHVAFKAARVRRAKVTSVDKANVLDTSKLWRAVVREVAQEYSDIELVEMLVDNCAMQIIINPAQFDVVLTSNMFGDILSDAGAVLPGSLGLLSSASFSKTGFSLFEPPGGSAPDIAGKGIANPIAQILSVALMLRYAFNMEQEAQAIEKAVELSLERGYRTRDIKQDNCELLGCSQMTDVILSFLN